MCNMFGDVKHDAFSELMMAEMTLLVVPVLLWFTETSLRQGGATIVLTYGLLRSCGVGQGPPSHHWCPGSAAPHGALSFAIDSLSFSSVSPSLERRGAGRGGLGNSSWGHIPLLWHQINLGN